MLGGDEEAVAVEMASHSGTEPQTGEGERLTFEGVGDQFPLAVCSVAVVSDDRVGSLCC